MSTPNVLTTEPLSLPHNQCTDNMLPSVFHPPHRSGKSMQDKICQHLRKSRKTPSGMQESIYVEQWETQNSRQALQWSTTNEPQHDKTNKITCAPSEDPAQPGFSPSLIRVFAVRMRKTLGPQLPTECTAKTLIVGRHFVGFVVQRLKCNFLDQCLQSSWQEQTNST